LGDFKIAGQLADYDLVKMFHQKAWRTIFTRRRLKYYREKDLSFDPSILELGEKSYLSGYWQTELYFKEIADQIRKDFTLKKTLPGSVTDLQKEMMSSESVAIHFRRTDYLSKRVFASMFHQLDDSYYQKALEIILTKNPNAKFFLFSDDPDFIKAKYGSRENFICVSGNRELSPTEEMVLMSNCKHFIIANSTFSWWAAWLGSFPEKRVVAPKGWFQDPKFVNRDILNPEWIKI